MLHYLSLIDVERGGVVRALLNLVGAQVKSGAMEHATLACHRIAGELPASDRQAIEGGGSIEELGGKPPVFGGIGERLGALIDAHDVVHLHGVWAPVNAAIARHVLSAGKPYVVTPHGMLGGWALSQKPLKKRLYLRWRGSRYLRSARALIYCCEDERVQASGVLKHPSTAVVPLVVEMGGEGAAVARTSGGSGAFAVGYLGRLHPVKGVDLLIGAVERLVASGERVTLSIAGTGDAEYERELRAIAEPLVAAGRCRFLGFVDAQAKARFLASLDVLGLPSSHENFGLSWAEALHARVPVVVTRGVGPWREIEESGGYVTERSVESIAATLRSVMSGREDAAARAGRGSAWVRSAFSPANVARATVDVYRDALRRPPARSSDTVGAHPQGTA